MTMAVYLTKKQQDRKSAKGDKYLRQFGQEIAVASFIRKISTFCDLPRRRSRSHSHYVSRSVAGRPIMKKASVRGPAPLLSTLCVLGCAFPPPPPQRDAKAHEACPL